LLRYAVIAACVLIVLLAIALALSAARRRRTQAARRPQATQRPGQGGSPARRPGAGAPSQTAGRPGAGMWGQPRALGPGGAASGRLGGAGKDGAPRIIPLRTIGTLGMTGRAQRSRRPTGKPPWDAASPPAAELPRHPGYPALPPGDGSAAPLSLASCRAMPGPPAAGGPPAGQPAALAPWEQSPEEFAAAPVPTDVPEWLVNSGPMYVWNPNASTAPQPAIAKDEEQGGD